MFSSSELTHLIFADRQDTYYYHSLRLSLNAYLWFLLKQKQYSAVYFPDLQDGGFIVKTFGDSQAKPPENLYTKFIHKISVEKLKAWMSEQLTLPESQKVAFVFSLSQFCTFFEPEERLECLRAFAQAKNRTGIFVLTASVIAEESHSLLLHSPVFDALGDAALTGIRDLSVCDFFTHLFLRKPKSCLFLNTFSRERIRELLLRQMLHSSAKLPAYAYLQEMTDYLFQYIHNTPFREAENRRGISLPFSCNLSFSEIYRQLDAERVWNTLAERGQFLLRFGGCQTYLSSLSCTTSPDKPTASCIRRQKDGWADRCLHLTVPFSESNGASSEEINLCRKLIAEIQHKKLRMKNRDESEWIIGNILSLLDNLPVFERDRDIATYRRSLEAILLCIRLIHVSPASDEAESVEKILLSLDDYIRLSIQCHKDPLPFGGKVDYASKLKKAYDSIVEQVKNLENPPTPQPPIDPDPPIGFDPEPYEYDPADMDIHPPK